MCNKEKNRQGTFLLASYLVKNKAGPVFTP